MKFFNTIYLLLLIYIIAALLFWGFSLHRQSEQIFQQQLLHLKSQVDSVRQPDRYAREIEKLMSTRLTRKKQYTGEGVTFLLVIFIGAAVVYSSFRRSIHLSRQQTNFMLSVTHELKSPLAAVMLNLQTLEKYKLSEEKKQELITRCIRETDRLNSLCNNILLASQMEGRQYKPEKERLAFGSLVQQVVEEFQHSYPGRISWHPNPEEGMVDGDPLMLRMLVSNLLGNALKYSPVEKPVQVVFSLTKRFCILEVKDEGIGIPDAEKKKIFQKFYRVGNENIRKTKGTGLGLYLAAMIVRRHKGSLVARNNKLQGTVFELTLLRKYS